MIAASACFTVMAACVKALGPSFPFVEAIFFRSALALPFLLVYARQRGVSLRPGSPILLLARSVFGLLAMSGTFYALQRGLLAEITVIGRLQPVLIALLAPLLLREAVPRAAALTLIVALAGALLVIAPWNAPLDLHRRPAVVALAAAVASAGAHLVVRRLHLSDRPLVIVVYFAGIVSCVAGAASIPSFVAPDTSQWPLLAGASTSATAGQLLMTTAYGRDRAPVIAAAGYVSVVFSLIAGLIVWHEWPAPLALVGAALITGAGLTLAFARSRSVS